MSSYSALLINFLQLVLMKFSNHLLKIKTQIVLALPVLSNSFATPWITARQIPLFMGFPSREYWSGLPFPSPGYLPDPGIEPGCPALEADALTSEPPGKSREWLPTPVLLPGESHGQKSLAGYSSWGRKESDINE